MAMNNTRTARPNGRPRLDHEEGFYQNLDIVLCAMHKGEMSQAEAAQEMGISVMSLKRYRQLLITKGDGVNHE